MSRLALLAALALGLAVPAGAQATADAAHTVTVEVTTVRAISVGADLTLALAAPAPGDASLRYSGSSTYGVLTNTAGDVVTASVAGLPAAGLTLQGTYGAPAPAVGLSDVVLTETEQTVVIGVSYTSEDGLSIDYEAETDLDLPPGQYDLAVTYTIKSAV